MFFFRKSSQFSVKHNFLAFSTCTGGCLLPKTPDFFLPFSYMCGRFSLDPPPPGRVVADWFFFGRVEVILPRGSVKKDTFWLGFLCPLLLECKLGPPEFGLQPWLVTLSRDFKPFLLNRGLIFIFHFLLFLFLIFIYYLFYIIFYSINYFNYTRLFCAWPVEIPSIRPWPPRSTSCPFLEPWPGGGTALPSSLGPMPGPRAPMVPPSPGRRC